MPATPTRRRFLTTAAATAAAAGLPHASGASHASTNTYHEAARDVPVVEETDVLVAGAGPAGIAAALAAARAGARTRLIETDGCLGGTWTAGLLCWVIDAAGKGGIMAELIQDLKARGSYVPRRGPNFAFDAEIMKLLLEDKMAEAGARIRLRTRIVDAGAEDGRLTTAVTESKSGREAWRARVFVDCTGDGDLAARAGCGFDLGHPETGKCQPMTLFALMTGIRFQEIEPFVGGGMGEPKRRLLAAIRKGGFEPSYHGPTLFRIRDDLFTISANHQYGRLATSAADVTAATLQGRQELHAIAKALRSLGEPWSDLAIVATAEHIGVREGRRIHGRYTVTVDDMVKGARFDDAVCRATFCIDVHSTDPGKTKGIEGRAGVKTQPYDIPLRSLIAKDVKGLMMAGRCISGDFLAHSSYRVTGNAVAMGEAAGRHAAECALAGTTP
jgi:hypothetical protein